jgi:hypothetical protein
MRMFIGAVIAVLGVVLVVMGLDAEDSVSSRLSKLFTGSPTDKTIWLLVGGAIATAVGIAMAFTGRSRGERLS